MASEGQTILFAGGGSGGHISPGLAVAERLRELDPTVKALFACSQRRIDATMLEQAGADYLALPASPPSINPRAALRFIRGFFRSRRLADGLLRDRGVTHVVALGGFVAAPVVAAARRARVPVTLVNLDVPPGRANRWIARRSDRVLWAVPVPQLREFREILEVRGSAERNVGLPVRRCALAPADQRACRQRLGLAADTFTLLITGASQGARSVNAAIVALAASQPAMFSRWQIYHLTGEGDDEPIRKAYAEAEIKAVVAPFLHEMGLAWGAADLAVTRAGANSVAEVAANAVPALFLPYPHHRDQHQRHNAQPLVDSGGAVMIEDHVDPAANAASIGPALQELMADSARRSAMRDSLMAARSNDSAELIARIILGISPDQR